MKRLLILLAVAGPLSAQQPVLERGDLLLTIGQSSPARGKVAVYSRGGAFKGNFASSSTVVFRDTLATSATGTVFVATPSTGITRYSANGVALSTFGRLDTNLLAPLADGGLVATNGSGALYSVGPDGSERVFHDAPALFEPNPHGLDVAPDQCTVYTLSAAPSVATWDHCRNSAVRQQGSPIQTTIPCDYIRLLPDGTLLTPCSFNVERVDTMGNILRSYPISGSGAIALDIDRASFWVARGQRIDRIDIVSGASLRTITLPINESVFYISIVGEPRASLLGLQDATIPMLSGWVLALLIAAITLVGVTRLQ